jgi:hypothetical protein
MNLNFATLGEVTFDMIPYLSKVLDDFPEKITGVSSTPAADHLFKIQDLKETRLLPKLQALCSIIPLPNFYSSLAHAGIFKQLLDFSLLGSSLLMKMTGANLNGS